MPKKKPAKGNLEEQVAPFFSVWESYYTEMRKACNFYKDSIKNREEPCTARFSCLEEIDGVFENTIKPLINRFYKERPLIKEGLGGTEDKDVYEKIKFWPVFIDGYVRPRVTINQCLITSEKDIWEAIEKNVPVDTKQRLAIEEEAYKRCLKEKENKENILAPYIIVYQPKSKEEIERDVRLQAVWSFETSLYSPWEAYSRAVLALVDWARSQPPPQAGQGGRQAPEIQPKKEQPETLGLKAPLIVSKEILFILGAIAGIFALLLYLFTNFLFLPLKVAFLAAVTVLFALLVVLIGLTMLVYWFRPNWFRPKQ